MADISFWSSNDRAIWLNKLDKYWDYVKPANRALEIEMEHLDESKVRNIPVQKFYNFLYEKYFVWKYTAPNRLATTRRYLEKHDTEHGMKSLQRIQNELFSFDKRNIEKGLEIASGINGLGVPGASGLLSILFPEYFGTVDQFVVKALMDVNELPRKSEILAMNPDSLELNDGVLLIEIFRRKSDELNEANKTTEWTPRKIDKVLWVTRN